MGQRANKRRHALTYSFFRLPPISFSIEQNLFCEKKQKKQWHRYQRASTRNMQSCFSKCCWLGLLQLYTACFDGRPLEKKVNIKRSFVAACHQTRIINQASRASIGTLQNIFFDPRNLQILFRHARIYSKQKKVCNNFSRNMYLFQSFLLGGVYLRTPISHVFLPLPSINLWQG